MRVQAQKKKVRPSKACIIAKRKNLLLWHWRNSELVSFIKELVTKQIANMWEEIYTGYLIKTLYMYSTMLIIIRNIIGYRCLYCFIKTICFCSVNCNSTRVLYLNVNKHMSLWSVWSCVWLSSQSRQSKESQMSQKGESVSTAEENRIKHSH